ncbi:diadenylate cyclase CdaA [Leptospira sp. 2 VSF19]|uniref:Diadenylate cyclase n=1 Tax=Leptospira soteropolitanensis TaxID=2950025 RepID=A0AAW5VJB3_9LEPT|nr:diadenylate cyclase CdaA [Leptospira soteropolitanensis]MCW7494408.1 diadenylate cyclase CdaA [Leptospira soteropolitanensis]MCW7501883.1 diadenylate cyclase CdaA [Leptospira soteropolitanensis]MCW7524254.1 diadenylate cyclase CdaA [Leptospira soteropolitanensis]MCW7528119.1 diadenylate cyclase CdaA [Leptospira soteropolitanensis]MCW7531973.1 diadenylate cyclase CdaA [Leptospira soteropolitanensis]
MDFFRGLYIIPWSKNYISISLDVLIVAFLIYKTYTTLRRTRGIQLLLGVGIIWISGSLAEYLGFELLEWILTNIRPALVFAIIVLLQPELRRLTGDLARIRLLRLFFLKPTFDLDPIVEAVRIMSQEKTGSIIVLVKDISLKDISENAVPLDAQVTSEVLQTIFFKNSPLHDGAVIIEQNRIVCAASYLPMSSSVEISTLGARHRSALGLSEETDAIIIVTSEETGDITICYEGEMIHPVKPLELKALVSSLMTGTRKAKDDSLRKSKEKDTGVSI